MPHPGDTGQVRRGWWWLLLVAVVAVLVTFALDRQWLFFAGYGLAMTAVLVWTFPWRGRGGTSQAELDRLPADDPARAVVIYWRPGCPYCSALRRRLGRLGRSATWINIWTDEDAAAYLRSVNDGNETVPTVVIDGVAHTNPPAGQVRPHLVAAA